MKTLVLFFVCAAVGMVEAQSEPPSPAVPSRDYFPAGVFDTNTANSSAMWYGRTLAALEEPSLFAMNEKTIQVYRFLWLPSFHRPISVRLTVNADGSGSVITKSVDKHMGLLLTKDTDEKLADSGKLIIDTTTEASREQIQNLVEQLQSLGFWSLPTEEPDEKEPDSKVIPGAHMVRVPPVDGARWILEGLRNGEYHVTDRWSPKNNSYSQLCKYLLKLGQVEVDLY